MFFYYFRNFFRKILLCLRPCFGSALKKGLAQYFLFSVKEPVVGDSLLQCGNAEAVKGSSKSFLGVSVLLIPKHYLFYYVGYLVYGVKSAQQSSHSLGLSPGTAYKHTADSLCLLGHGTEGAFSDASAASVASASASVPKAFTPAVN